MSPGSSSGALKALVLVVGICAGLVVLILSLCDPRWAVAASLVLSVFGGQGLVSCLSGRAPVDTWLRLLALWIVVPAGETRVRA